MQTHEQALTHYQVKNKHFDLTNISKLLKFTIN
jgi:hypothetical protein